MGKAYLEITHCSQCPNKDTGNYYSTDGFDRMEDWLCKVTMDPETAAPRKIAASVEWHEEKDIKIPDWCPLIRKDLMVAKPKPFTRDEVNINKLG